MIPSTRVSTVDMGNDALVSPDKRGLADSLSARLGRAINFRPGEGRLGFDATGMMADPDTIYLWKSFLKQPEAQQRRILAHEVGHGIAGSMQEAYFKPDMQRVDGKLQDTPKSLEEQYATAVFRDLLETYELNREKLPDKSKESFDQYLAEVFANAHFTAQRMDQLKPGEASNLLAVQEQGLPGTMTMLEYIQKMHPVKDTSKKRR